VRDRGIGLTVTKQRHVGQSFGFEEVAEGCCKICTKTVPFQTELLLLRVHLNTRMENIMSWKKTIG
jgi:hypothetical protein